MNGIQRVLAAINKSPLDRIPRGELIIDKGFIKKFFITTNVDLDMEIEFLHRLGLDLICLQNEEQSSHPGTCQTSSHCVKRFGDAGFFVFLLLNGSFQSMVNQMGLMNVLKDIAGRPEKLGQAMLNRSRQVTELIRQGAAKGVHGILIADDIAYNRGTYMAPAFIQEWLLPCWLEQTSTARTANLPVFFHSDGNINAILPLLVEAGFNGLQCMEPASGMDIKQIKQEYGSHFCLMGNIDPALLSEDGADTLQYHELACAVHELVSVAAPGGGFIFGTCSGLHMGLSPTKVSYMFELASLK